MIDRDRSITGGESLSPAQREVLINTTNAILQQPELHGQLQHNLRSNSEHWLPQYWADEAGLGDEEYAIVNGIYQRAETAEAPFIVVKHPNWRNIGLITEFDDSLLQTHTDGVFNRGMDSVEDAIGAYLESTMNDDPDHYLMVVDSGHYRSAYLSKRKGWEISAGKVNLDNGKILLFSETEPILWFDEDDSGQVEDFSFLEDGYVYDVIEKFSTEEAGALIDSLRNQQSVGLSGEGRQHEQPEDLGLDDHEKIVLEKYLACNQKLDVVEKKYF